MKLLDVEGLTEPALWLIKLDLQKEPTGKPNESFYLDGRKVNFPEFVLAQEATRLAITVGSECPDDDVRDAVVARVKYIDVKQKVDRIISKINVIILINLGLVVANFFVDSPLITLIFDFTHAVTYIGLFIFIVGYWLMDRIHPVPRGRRLALKMVKAKQRELRRK